MGWLVRFVLFSLLITLVVREAMRLLAGIVEGATGGGARTSAPASTKMVKDPVCGTYVVPSKALMGSRGSQTAWFCSPECQRAWQHR